jgi:hypothetical protein
LREAGLDFYNHNVDTSPEFYGKIITTRTLQDRIDTLAHVRAAGIKVCCGGIIGMGEGVADRLGMLVLLANLPRHPESVPINLWNEVQGVPVNDTAERPDPIGPRAPCRGRPHHDAAKRGAAIRRAAIHDRRIAGAVLSRRRQFDLHRRRTSDHPQPAARPTRSCSGGWASNPISTRRSRSTGSLRRLMITFRAVDLAG